MTIQSLSLNTKNINFKLSKESFELEATVSLEQAINLLNSSEKIICFNKITLNVSDVKSTKDQKFLCDALIQFINKNKTLTQFELSFTNDIHFSKNQSMNILSAYEDNKFLMNFKLPVHEKLVDERSKIELEKLKSSYLENEKFKINIYGFFEKLNEKTKKLNTVKEIDVKKLEKSIEKLDKEYVDLENSFNSLTLDSKMKNELNEQLMNAKNKIGIFKECKKDRQFTLKEKEITNVMTKNSLNN
jgi:exonuclease VII small subunit